MFERTVSPADLERLRLEREKAHAAYVDTLAALDRAVQSLQDLPAPPTHYDEHEINALNEGWRLGSTEIPRTPGWRGVAQGLLWPLLSPVLDRQQSFNATVVRHINRNIERHRHIRTSVTELVRTLQDAVTGMAAFETQVVRYAQDLGPFVETQTLEVSALSRRITEDVAETTAGLVSTVSGVADELRKRWETSVATERRLESRLDELSSTVAVAHQVAHTLKREIARVTSVEPSAGVRGASPVAESSPLVTSELDSYKYVGFENAFRGSPEDIRARLEQYLEYFEGSTDVLDVGCGRGEFLELLRGRGIGARGIDLNHEMVEQCRTQGLDVDKADFLTHLSHLEDGALGGLFASQVVEHLEPQYLLETLDLAFHKLRPGSVLILETINVASWSAFFQSYIRDITHVQPLHPDTLRYLVTASGFQHTDVVYCSPCASHHRLERMPNADGSTTGHDLARIVHTFNENADKLNRLLFADQDYAVIGKRL
jgi:2-polyprenyl-3-methyl-5-hydroxy-6-metoxy-1,4-benzoquinol methylase